MTEQTIFSADQAQQAAPAVQQEPPKPFVIPTEAQELIGDGKKYNSAEAALKSIPHAQTHIKTLEDENKQLKDELLRRKTAEEVLNEFKATSVQPQYTEQPSGVNVDTDALAGIVESVLEKKTKQTQAVSNAAVVTSKFTELYGDKAEAMYNKLAQENGLSVYQLNQLALTSPSVVLNLAGVASRAIVGKTTSDVNVFQNNQNTQFNTTVKVGATTRQVMDAFAASKAKVLDKLQKENK